MGFWYKLGYNQPLWPEILLFSLELHHCVFLGLGAKAAVHHEDGIVDQRTKWKMSKSVWEEPKQLLTSAKMIEDVHLGPGQAATISGFI